MRGYLLSKPRNEPESNESNGSNGSNGSKVSKANIKTTKKHRRRRRHGGSGVDLDGHALKVQRTDLFGRL